MKVAFFHGLESPAVSDKSEYLQSAFAEAYTPEMNYNKPGLFDEVEGQRIILVDDYKTSGTTIKEMLRQLSDAGAAEVVVFVLLKIGE